MTGSSRLRYNELLYDIWIKEFLKKSFCSKIRFFSDKQIQTNNSYIQSNYIKANPYKDDNSRDFLSSKLLFAMRDFLNNSKADWFLRICDDTFINLRAFDQFYSELNLAADPNTDKLVQGNCIHKPISNIYIQGGSGLVFSRFSVIEFISNFSFFKTLSHTIKNDDTAIGAWLIHRNYSAKSITNRFFIGHLFYGYKTFINLSKSGIRKCSFGFLQQQQSCRGFITNLNEIVFWHDRVSFMRFLPFAKNFISSLPNDLFFSQLGRYPYVCRGKNSNGKYYE